MGILEELMKRQRGGAPSGQQQPWAPADAMQQLPWAPPSAPPEGAMQQLPWAPPKQPMQTEDAMQLLGGGGGGGGAAPAPQQIDPAMIQSLLEQMQMHRERPPAAQPTKPQPLWGKK